MTPPSRLLLLALLGAVGCAQGSSESFALEGSGRSADAAPRDAGAATDAPGGGFGIADAAADGGGVDTEDASPTCVPSMEICNGVDDDCDGAIDDDDACPCAVSERLGHAYLFCDDARAFGDAKTRCRSLGYELAVIEDADEDAFVYGQIAGLAFADTWIGMTDDLAEGDWRWVDGTPFAYTHWDEGEPNDAHGRGEDCGVIMTREGRESEWDDRGCLDARPYVCESTGGV